MAVFRPDATHLAEQFASLAAQTYPVDRLVVVIADTVSKDLVTQTANDHHLTVSLLTPMVKCDTVRAFEQGLAHALSLYASSESPPFIALSDQDDIWHSNRIQRGVEALQASDASLVHSDARLVAGDGTTVLNASMFQFERRHPTPGLRGLLYRNNTTGMTCIMRAELVEMALPFPTQNGVHFYHDLWLSLMAEATGGGVHLLTEALVDYRQHNNNAIGAVDRQKKPGRSITKRVRSLNMRKEAAPYALARYLAHSTRARVNALIKDGKLRTEQVRIKPLGPYMRYMRGGVTHFWDALVLGLSGRFGLARIAAGFGVVNIGRSVWALRAALTQGVTHAMHEFDNRLYSLSPGLTPQNTDQQDVPSQVPQPYTNLQDPRKHPGWKPVFSATAPAVCVMVPSLNPTEMFAGIVSAIDIGLGLVARGIPVRFIATNMPVSSAETSRYFLEHRMPKRDGMKGAAASFDVQCGVHSDTLPAHADDQFLATAWWTAHCADTLIKAGGYNTDAFIYLIQDHEPHFYAWGQEFADATDSYDLNFRPIFNTTLLRDHFASLGYKFARKTALAFHPAITIETYADRPRPARKGPRRLAIYGRPSVARNMLSSTIEALVIFITEQSLTPDDIELVSVGEAHQPVALPNDLILQSKGKLPLADYPDFLASIDLGLSLMYSPHPSHPPIEMAAAGARVITNRFGQKNLSTLSPAILSASTTPTDLAHVLTKAWKMGPVSQADRNIDLTQLGFDLNHMLDKLAKTLPAPLRNAKRP